MKSSLLWLFYHFYQVRRKRRHGHGYHPLQTDNHTTVSRTFHLYKHPLVALEVTTRNTDSSSFRQIQLFGLEIKQMVVIGSGYGDEALHLMVGNNYLLTTASIGYILQISNLRLDTLYVGRTCMDGGV